MAVVEVDKVMTLSGIAAQSDQIPLPPVMMQGFDLVAEYTVTDVGIQAGEFFMGYIDTIEIVGDGDKVFEVKTDEITDVIAMLHGRNSGINTQYYTDVLPTTAELQRAHFFVPFAHDLGQYKNVYMRILTRAATAEWGAASAMTGSVKLVLKTGRINHSVVVSRNPRGTATRHEVLLQRFPMIRALILGATANTCTRLELKGSDDKLDMVSTSHQAMAVAYHTWLGAVAADDTDTTIGVDDVLVVPSKNGSPQLNVDISSTAALVVYFMQIKNSVTPKGLTGDISRGKGPRAKVDYALTNIAKR